MCCAKWIIGIAGLVDELVGGSVLYIFASEVVGDGYNRGHNATG
jgi:hypothetical protein